MIIFYQNYIRCDISKNGQLLIEFLLPVHQPVSTSIHLHSLIYYWFFTISDINYATTSECENQTNKQSYYSFICVYHCIFGL